MQDFAEQNIRNQIYKRSLRVRVIRWALTVLWFGALITFLLYHTGVL